MKEEKPDGKDKDKGAAVTFTVNSLTRCAGQGHYVVNLMFASGPTVDLHTTKEAMEFDPAADLALTRQAILDRLRSAVKEANATTFAQARVALEGNSYKV